MRINIMNPKNVELFFNDPTQLVTYVGKSYDTCMCTRLRSVRYKGYGREFFEPELTLQSDWGWTATTSKYFSRNYGNNPCYGDTIYKSSKDGILYRKTPVAVPPEELLKDIEWYVSHGCDIGGAVIEVVLSLDHEGRKKYFGVDTTSTNRLLHQVFEGVPFITKALYERKLNVKKIKQG